MLPFTIVLPDLLGGRNANDDRIESVIELKGILTQNTTRFQLLFQTRTNEDTIFLKY